MIRIQRISMDHPLYEQEVALRTAVLLEPIGYTIQDYYDMSPGREEKCEHFVAVVDHPSGDVVVGAATLFPPQPGQEEQAGKVQQVCVDKQRQGEGIGKNLMIAIEVRAFTELALPGLYCHAQLSAMPFYERLGWETASDIFQEAGIDHKRMQIITPQPSETSV
ncbi:MAG: GNAT family N-acetyltransferase [Phycisphaerales bacterium]